MFYRENGQYKTSYAADTAIFPIRQDKIAIGLLLLFAFAGVPLLAIMGVGPFGHDYIFKAILIPFLILSLAAIGLNILVGYCGQISLGAGAFMAVGAYSAYNFALRIPELPLVISILLGGGVAALAGIVFGIPSLRIKGLYLAVATLAAQFFADWVFARVKWFTDYSHSGSVSVAPIELLGWTIDTPREKYLFLLGVLVVFTLIAKNLVRGRPRPSRACRGCGGADRAFSDRGAAGRGGAGVQRQGKAQAVAVPARRGKGWKIFPGRMDIKRKKKATLESDVDPAQLLLFR